MPLIVSCNLDKSIQLFCKHSPTSHKVAVKVEKVYVNWKWRPFTGTAVISRLHYIFHIFISFFGNWQVFAKKLLFSMLPLFPLWATICLQLQQSQGGFKWSIVYPFVPYSISRNHSPTDLGIHIFLHELGLPEDRWLMSGHVIKALVRCWAFSCCHNDFKQNKGHFIYRFLL